LQHHSSHQHRLSHSLQIQPPPTDSATSSDEKGHKDPQGQHTDLSGGYPAAGDHSGILVVHPAEAKAWQEVSRFRLDGYKSTGISLFF
jgi:hypothetical protein